MDQTAWNYKWVGSLMDHQVGRGIEHQYGANIVAVDESSLIHSPQTNPIKHSSTCARQQ